MSGSGLDYTEVFGGIGCEGLILLALLSLYFLFLSDLKGINVYSYDFQRAIGVGK